MNANKKNSVAMEWSHNIGWHNDVMITTMEEGLSEELDSRLSLLAQKKIYDKWKVVNLNINIFRHAMCLMHGPNNYKDTKT